MRRRVRSACGPWCSPWWSPPSWPGTGRHCPAPMRVTPRSRSVSARAAHAAGWLAVHEFPRTARAPVADHRLRAHVPAPGEPVALVFFALPRRAVITLSALANPRHVSMCSASRRCSWRPARAFRQARLQIEMHFYFFALIAMLGTFGNPLVIVTAAATIALHHSCCSSSSASMFNYDAAVWVESCTRVRRRRVGRGGSRAQLLRHVIVSKDRDARTSELHARPARCGACSIVDRVLVLDRDQIVLSARSAMVERGSARAHRRQASTTTSDQDPRFADMFDVNSGAGGHPPVELAVFQLPDAFHATTHFRVKYMPSRG